ncbi:MAG: hypothetical protein ABUL77_04770 [Bacteroidota bacterium]
MFRSPPRIGPNFAVLRPRTATARLLSAAVVAAVALVLGMAPAAHAVPRRAKTSVKTKSTAKAKAKSKPTRKGRGKTKVAVEIPVANAKVAVFTFKGESAAPVNQQVVRVLRTKGMDVTTTLRPVDSAEQYREMAATLGLAMYVHGQVIDNGEQARATIHIRSGVTGRRIASAKFSGDSRSLPDDISRTLWDQMGRTVGRACVQAAKPRRREHAPLRIEAGTPIETTPADAAGEQGT